MSGPSKKWHATFTQTKVPTPTRVLAAIRRAGNSGLMLEEVADQAFVGEYRARTILRVFRDGGLVRWDRGEPIVALAPKPNEVEILEVARLVHRQYKMR